MKLIFIVVAVLLALPLQIAWNWALPHPDVPLGRPRPLTLDPARWFHLIDPPGFAIGYGEWLQNPLWVSWEVPAGPLQPLQKRPRQFSCGSGTLAQVCAEDYRNSGYDRGHLAPNYAMSRLHGRAAQVASFSMANITPQKHAMNARAWQRLEEVEMDRLRPQAPDRFWVMTGPLFEQPPRRLDSGVAIPVALWRIWVRERTGAASGVDRRWEVLAFVVPQTATGYEDLRRFLTTVDAVEERSGFDLLHQLPDPVEDKLEAEIRAQDWKLGSGWTDRPRY